MTDFLEDLLAATHARLEDLRRAAPLESVRDRALSTAPPPSFREALSGPGVAVIAEVKRASPSRGALAPDLDAGRQAQAYRDGGASAVSVVTEPEQFGGRTEDLSAAAASGLAVLRKDFVLDRYQIWEARASGAAAVLLIVAALDETSLRGLMTVCEAAGVEALVEVHDHREAERARDAGASVVGVNARDLRTFEVDRDAFARVRPALGSGVLAVAESGIRGPEDVRRAAIDGADAVLVGEAAVTASDPAGFVAALVSAGATPVTATEYR